VVDEEGGGGCGAGTPCGCGKAVPEVDVDDARKNAGELEGTVNRRRHAARWFISSNVRPPSDVVDVVVLLGT
jgi:hypothetical protein